MYQEGRDCCFLLLRMAVRRSSLPSLLSVGPWPSLLLLPLLLEVLLPLALLLLLLEEALGSWELPCGERMANAGTSLRLRTLLTCPGRLLLGSAGRSPQRASSSMVQTLLQGRDAGVTEAPGCWWGGCLLLAFWTAAEDECCRRYSRCT